MNTATATRWATLKRNPTDPRPSQFDDCPPQHMATIQLEDDTEARIYFDEGVYSHLRKDDTVLVEAGKNGKWRLSKTQTPELMKAIAQRTNVSAPAVVPNSAPAPTHPSAATQIESDGLWSDDRKRRMAREVEQSALLFRYCWDRAVLAMGEVASKEEIRAIATTLFIQAMQVK